MVRFFEDVRPLATFTGGKLYQDKESGKRYWKIKLSILLLPEQVFACDTFITSNYEQIEARENNVEELSFAAELKRRVVVHTLPKNAEAQDTVLLQLPSCYLCDMSMERKNDATLLILHLDHPLTTPLHDFVRDYAYASFWVEFEPVQHELDLGKAVASKSLQSAVARLDAGGTSTLTTPEGDVIPFGPDGPEKRKQAAKKGRVH